MNIEIRFVGMTASPALKERIRRRAEFAMDRFVHAIRGLRITISDVNGPKGGSDQRSIVELTPTVAGRPLVARALADTAEESASKALGRVRRRIQRLLEERRLSAA